MLRTERRVLANDDLPWFASQFLSQDETVEVGTAGNGARIGIAARAAAPIPGMEPERPVHAVRPVPGRQPRHPAGATAPGDARGPFAPTPVLAQLLAARPAMPRRLLPRAASAPAPACPAQSPAKVSAKPPVRPATPACLAHARFDLPARKDAGQERLDLLARLGGDAAWADPERFLSGMFRRKGSETPYKKQLRLRAQQRAQGIDKMIENEAFQSEAVSVVKPNTLALGRFKQTLEKSKFDNAARCRDYLRALRDPSRRRALLQAGRMVRAAR